MPNLVDIDGIKMLDYNSGGEPTTHLQERKPSPSALQVPKFVRPAPSDRHHPTDAQCYHSFVSSLHTCAAG